MTGGLRFGSLFKIPLYVDFTWFLVFFLITSSYGTMLSTQFPQWGLVLAWGTGVILSLSVFASVLLHELGHSIAAQLQGIKVKSIHLFLLGGLAQIEEESKTPWGAFWVAIAGPLVSLGIFLGMSLLPVQAQSPIGVIVSGLAVTNFFLCVFNLLPGLPLDGGNIVKAIIWGITGDKYKGIRGAALGGRLIGWSLIGLALVPVLLRGNFDNIWYAVVGWFVLSTANRYELYAKTESHVQSLVVESSMAVPTRAVPQTTSVEQFVSNYLISMNDQPYPVVNEANTVVGTIGPHQIQALTESAWPHTSISQVMHRLDGQDTVSPGQSLEEALKRIRARGSEFLVMVRPNGEFMGFVTEEQMQSHLLRELQFSGAKG
jgi:Zn-dependent protease